MPANWASLRLRVLARDRGRCTWLKQDGTGRCTSRATDVDHVRAGDNNDMSNLASLCGWHHDRKSAREGVDAAEESRKREKASSRFDGHPGLG